MLTLQVLAMFTELQMEWISKELLFLSQLKIALELQTPTQSMLEIFLKLRIFLKASP
jgi:hypothetical protein